MNENEENIKKHSKHNKKNIIKDYVFINAGLLAIALIFTVVAILSLLNTATSAVHKFEKAMPMDVCDITISDGEIADIESADFGDYVADIECADRGFKTKVYLGYNRVCARYGAALSSTGGLFDGGTTIATGYDETYFASLKYIEKGDVINVNTASGEIAYKVTDAYYESESMSLDDADSDLVLFSYFSDFSDNSGKCYYVFADKATGEGS